MVRNVRLAGGGIVLSLLLVLAALWTPPAKAHTVEGLYKGHSDSSLMILPPYGNGKVQKSHVAPLVSYPERGEGAKETVYCFNMNRSIPDERDSLDGPFDVNNFPSDRS